MQVTVLGIDPGLADLGWGVLDFHQGRPSYVSHGVLKTKPGPTSWVRVRTLASGLRGLIARYKVHAVGVEEWIFYSGHATTASHDLGLVIGALIGLSPVPVYSAGGASAWRTSLGLQPKCTKRDVQQHLQSRLRLPKLPTPQHASDALAVALAVFPLI